jgi:hypothetical protein
MPGVIRLMTCFVPWEIPIQDSIASITIVRTKQPRDLDTLIARQIYSSTIDRLNDPFEFVALRNLADYPDKMTAYGSAGVTYFCRSITNPLL